LTRPEPQTFNRTLTGPLLAPAAAAAVLLLLGDASKAVSSNPAANESEKSNAGILAGVRPGTAGVFGGGFGCPIALIFNGVLIGVAAASRWLPPCRGVAGLAGTALASAARSRCTAVSTSFACGRIAGSGVRSAAINLCIHGRYGESAGIVYAALRICNDDSSANGCSRKHNA